MKQFFVQSFLTLLILPSLLAHPEHHSDPFRQLEEILPTPTDTRTASGAPGHRYWQQRADYDIAITLNEDNKTVTGKETITYKNNSPDTLSYLWLQLDRNRFSPESAGHQTREAPNFSNMKMSRFKMLMYESEFDGCYEIKSVTDSNGKKLPHQIVQTMMRVDLPTPLSPKQEISFNVEWSFCLNDRTQSWGRSGYEVFEEDQKALFQVAQFFPRMAAYTDVNGWQHKQFLGRGEFTLEFGDYKVALTVPADHVVASTGTLQNPKAVLSSTMRERLEQAKTSKEPVMIVTADEAAKAIENTDADKSSRTWIFHADNVRDFAFATSARFIWDAIEHTLPDSNKKVWAMSYYPPEALPLWEKYSTHSVIHALNVYSKHTFDYPYPVAISVHGKIWGMEYPMISFNGARPEEDGSYTERTKKGLISVIIHEVGHNWFPMIVNSDERQWTWMDEGLNSFLQSIAEEEWSDKPYNVPSLPVDITSYMRSSKQRPIMTNSESILQFGANAYGKPAAALTVLRETVMGRELFDFAFKEYANRWRFKRPQPADFFRSMEDASGLDLDWFWRGWFYGTAHVDLSIGDIALYQVDSQNPEDKKTREKEKHEKDKASNITHKRNAEIPKYIGTATEVSDFYSSYDPFLVTDAEMEDFDSVMEKFKDEEQDIHQSDDLFYVATIHNKGGLVSPILLQAHFESGAVKNYKIPAEIWKKNPKKINRLIISKEELIKIVIDPQRETADVDHDNNIWPKEPIKKHFQIKPNDDGSKNPMQKAREAKEEAEEES